MKKSLRIKKRYFFDIRNGLKPLEARCGYPSLRRIQAGDQIEFQWNDDVCLKTVKTVREYLTVGAMLEKENIPQLLPGVSTYAEAFQIYSEIYSAKKVKQNGGMLVFELE